MKKALSNILGLTAIAILGYESFMAVWVNWVYHGKVILSIVVGLFLLGLVVKVVAGKE